MSNKTMIFLKLDQITSTTRSYDQHQNSAVETFVRGSAILFLLLSICFAFTGCGSGGYAGGGIVSLSASAVTLDAGQSFAVTSKLSGSPNVGWALSSTMCNAGACGTLSASAGNSVTYTAPSGITSQMVLTLTAAVTGTTSKSAVTITVNPDPTISGNPPSGTVGTAYTSTLIAAGGTAPLKWSVASGMLPAGLTFDTTSGVISGTPTAVGTSSFTVQITDSSDIPDTVTAAETIAVTTSNSGTSPLTVIAGNPPAGTVGVGYTTTLTASGGVTPYMWSVISGSLPAGLALSPATGVISGTPTTQGTFTFTAQAQDASGTTASANFSIKINAAAATLTLTGLPGATVGVPYTGTIGATGGTPPYTCAIVAGTLPAGLTLSGCVISGTPTVAGTTNITVTVTDSGSPVATVTGPVTITVSPAALTLTVSSLPNGTVGVAYTATIGVAGGTSPYACAITAGTLPAGLSLSGCVVSGTPTVAGTANMTVKATDSSTIVETTSGPVSLTILPAPLSLTLSSLPDATVGTPYTATIGVAGGTAPYSCVITAGLLPAGLSISGCVVSGTPTVAGTVGLTVKATDSSPTVETTTGPVSLTVLPASVVLTLSSPPNATVGVLYTGTIGVAGGTAPYSCTITAGTLPAGLTASGCAVSGTPTTPGTANLTVKATDGSSPVNTTTGPVTLTVSPASATLTLSNPPNATVGVLYSGSIGVAGGTSPYTCTITAGTLPAGLTATNCLITGTPTTAGTANLTVKATDSTTPTAATITGPVTLTVSAVSPLSLTGSLPNAIVGVPYTQTLTATGGVPPYSYQISVPSLPAGLSLSTGGVISGTPTTPGASSFTVKVTDTESTPQTATLALVLLVVYPLTPNDPELTGPYAYLFQGYDDVLLGVLSYQTATVGSFTADGAGGINSGELDANHQSSNPTGNTISSNAFLGTYTIGTDNRGMMTITNLNADGTTAGSATYAISVKAPVSPSTISTQADMIEFDNANLAGTRGSGTMLAQVPAALAAGLSGSYVFGLSGDAPCLPACTAGLIAGPAAAVGQFTTSGSTLVGTGDSNNGASNYPTEVLGGSFATADANGRVALTMTTANTPTGYPTDYAVYLVNANQSFVMSTDKHSSFLLLAGSTQLQTQSSFSNASMSGPFIGYENSATNPGLVTGLVLENVLNLSTATIFRGTATANGSCNVTNVDLGGTTGLVNELTGLLPGLSGLLGGLLGSDATTGPITCDVASYGRGTLQYPAPTLLGIPAGPAPAPRVFYLSAPDHGYFLESGYAGLGNLEAQTGAPFTTATFDGTFVYGTTAAASLASINASGNIVANGTGSATSTVDENLGVGNINLLSLDVTSTNPYTLTDAIAGRYTYGTDVIYAITPTRFVLVDTNALTTSPSITLLY
ncbi:putative Ig domain-containing protein [Granulicella sp. S190]|uniref:beta strand repeat-containing protein n=1 Tax=Granulicella sp. S190 TaxID=1747226 RepID=UPI0020B10636|nr:putative Ig domain-containing protein [Granulicella sp. S190]